MTQVIIGNRGSGKTTYLVKKAAETGSVILTSSPSQIDNYLKIAADLGLSIKDPRLAIGNVRGSSDKFIIDDMESFLANTLGIGPERISYISVSTPIKDLVPITNKDPNAVLKKAIKEKEKKEKKVALRDLIEQKEDEEKKVEELAELLWERERRLEEQREEIQREINEKRQDYEKGKTFTIPNGYDYEAWEKLGAPLYRTEEIKDIGYIGAITD